ncbi:MAG: hypothetical protein AAFY26_00810 [Cyanobacteria bacterium J06638_22]
MDYPGLQEYRDEQRQWQRDAAREFAEDGQNQLIAAYLDGKRGAQPQSFTQPYLECWGIGFAALVRARHESGWNPVLEFRYARNPYGSVDGDPSEFAGSEPF